VLRKKCFVITLLFALAGILAPQAQAQYLGTTSPQSVQATLATSLPCTGTAQNFTTGLIPNFDNLGQTQHYAYATAGAAVTTLTMQIFGLDPSGNAYAISDMATTSIPAAGVSTATVGTGYFTNIRVTVTCLPVTTGTFTLNYTGTSSTPSNIVGSYQIAMQDKVINSQSSAGTSSSINFFSTPYGNSQGVVYFEFLGTGPAGSSINVNCQTTNGSGPPSWVYTVATTDSVTQRFPVPPEPCPTISVGYNSGGASASVVLFDYVFMQPGTTDTDASTHIAGTTATVVKSGPGVVHTVVIGTPAAGTVSLFDLAPAACTGTPATNVVSVITATATFPSAPEIYDTLFNHGICVKASATMDITVSTR
jgi:hypothetical protein